MCLFMAMATMPWSLWPFEGSNCQRKLAEGVFFGLKNIGPAF
jgi:hypothetical protein